MICKNDNSNSYNTCVGIIFTIFYAVKVISGCDLKCESHEAKPDSFAFRYCLETRPQPEYTNIKMMINMESWTKHE